MFTYCGNNPVIFADPSGDVSNNVIFPVCCGGAGSVPTSGSSDGENRSDELLEYVCNIYRPDTNSTVYVNVTYEGIYSKKSNRIVNSAFAILGGSSLFLFIPSVKEVAILNSCLTVAGTASSSYGVLTLFAAEDIPDKDYYQYRATMSWTETTAVIGFPGVYTTVHYDVVIYFLWDDSSYTSPKWYVQSYDWHCEQE